MWVCIPQKYLKFKAYFIAGQTAEMKPLSVEIVWYDKDVEVCGCSWSMVRSQKPGTKNYKKFRKGKAN